MTNCRKNGQNYLARSGTWEKAGLRKSYLSVTSHISVSFIECQLLESTRLATNLLKNKPCQGLSCLSCQHHNPRSVMTCQARRVAAANASSAASKTKTILQKSAAQKQIPTFLQTQVAIHINIWGHDTTYTRPESC